MLHGSVLCPLQVLHILLVYVLLCNALFQAGMKYTILITGQGIKI